MIGVGSVVADRYGEVGRVDRLYDDFSACAMSCLTMTGEEWLQEQEVPFTTDHLDEVWAGVNLEAGGSIWSPLSLLTEERKAQESGRG